MDCCAGGLDAVVGLAAETTTAGNGAGASGVAFLDAADGRRGDTGNEADADVAVDVVEAVTEEEAVMAMAAVDVAVDDVDDDEACFAGGFCVGAWGT